MPTSRAAEYGVLPPAAAAEAAARRMEHTDAVAYHTAQYSVHMYGIDSGTNGIAFDIALPFNPNSISIRPAADVVQHAPLGWSQGRLQYIRTATTEYEFTVECDDFIMRSERPDINSARVRGILASLPMPTGPGRALQEVVLDWPNHVVCRGIVPRIDFEDTMFYANGAVRRWNARVTLIENRRSFMAAALVRQYAHRLYVSGVDERLGTTR